MNFPLRDYQKEALDCITNAFTKRITKQVLVLATGLGKTIIFSHLISDRVKSTGKKALIIAHREELLLQAKEKLQSVNPNLRIGIEQAEHTADHTNDDVVIASVQTIGKINSPRLASFSAREYSTIIIDEAHHASAASYKTILRHFSVLKNDDDTNRHILLLGVTATPRRNDNHGLDEIFDEVVFEYPIIKGIQNNCLSRIKALKIETGVGLDTVGTLGGDFQLTELEEAINTPERNAIILQAYKDHALGKQALIFAADVAHTENLYEVFKKEGIPVAYVTGKTEKEERKRVLQAFKRKEITVMINALVLTEGYDNESIEYVFMARPTKSGILYQQMIGRGTRKSDGKEFLMIIDFVDNTSKHSLQTAASLLGFEGTIDFGGQDILQAKKNIDELLEKRPFYNLNTLDMKDINYVMKEVELLQEQKIQTQLEQYTWHTFGEGMRMNKGNNTVFSINQSVTGQYVLSEYLKLVDVTKKLGEFASVGEAIKYADTIAAESFMNKQGTLYAVASDSKGWGSDVPSEAQINLLRNLGVGEQTILFLSKGEASQMISDLKRRRS